MKEIILKPANVYQFFTYTPTEFNFITNELDFIEIKVM